MNLAEFCVHDSIFQDPRDGNPGCSSVELAYALVLKVNRTLKNTIQAIFFFVALTLAIVHSTVFSYRFLTTKVHIDSSVVWFEDPIVPRVLVDLYRYNTTANVTLYAVPVFTLDRRAAIYFDTFDDNPFVAGRLAVLGCNWSWDPVLGAVFINGTQPYPGTWGRECIAVANLNVSSYTRAGRAVYVAFLFWRTPVNITDDIWADAVYVNTSLRYLYTIGWWLKGVNPGRTGDHVHPNIFYWSGTWTIIYDRHIGDYLPTFEEYILSHVTSMINFTAWTATLYNYTVSYSDTFKAGQRFFPDLVGIGINSINDDDRSKDVPRNFTGSIYFDNLVVTVDREPWIISFTGVPAGWRIVLRDSTGVVLANVTSPSPTAIVNISLWPPFADLLVNPYNRTGFVYPNASLEVYDGAGNHISTTTFDYIVGGDLFRFGEVYEFKGRILSVYTNMTTTINVMLSNATATIRPGVYGDLGLVSWNGLGTTENVTIRGGVVVRSETAPLLVNPPPTWSIKWLVANVTVEIRAPRTQLPYNLRLNLCWWITDGILVFYSINITIVPHL